MCRTACTEPQSLYKGALYIYLTVELYLYSPYVPYGLYSASVPVQGFTLHLPNSRAIPLLPLCAVRTVQSLSACTRVHFTCFNFKQQEELLSMTTFLKKFGAPLIAAVFLTNISRFFWVISVPFESKLAGQLELNIHIYLLIIYNAVNTT